MISQSTRIVLGFLIIIFISVRSAFRFRAVDPVSRNFAQRKPFLANNP